MKLEYDSGTNIYGKEKYSDLFGVTQNIASSWIILSEAWNVSAKKFVFRKWHIRIKIFCVCECDHILFQYIVFCFLHTNNHALKQTFYINTTSYNYYDEFKDQRNKTWSDKNYGK